jgi:ABC-type sugar transport system ATPase subunit/nitrogen-specific signal transduction histidine kinase
VQAPAPGSALLAARGLRVTYGTVVALDGVDLELRPGETVALAGENGAGKSTLVRCLCGDRPPDTGRVWVGGQPLPPDPRAAARLGVSVVWQDLSLCDNLDIAANLLLGREPRRFLVSAADFHERAVRLLADLGIRLPPTTTPVGHLSGGQRQLVAVARAMRDRPRLLILDEPTAALGVSESAQVEDLTRRLPGQGTTVLVVTHDLDQMFRLADRIVVMRRGRVVGEVRPAESHPDEVAALLSGQDLDESARTQLNRLHSLAGQLARAEPSSGLELIMSALGAALRADRVAVEVDDNGELRLVGAVGGSGPAGSSWSVPFLAAGGAAGRITIRSRSPSAPGRDERELAALYAGYVSSAIERDRLLGQVTARNRVLEAIREVLQVLAGPSPAEPALRTALAVLKRGLGAATVALLADDGGWVERARAGPPPAEPAWDGGSGGDDLTPQWQDDCGGGRRVVTTFPTPSGRAALAAWWDALAEVDPGADALIEDAAHSLRLAFEREASERAQREAMALRSSQEQQRRFLSFLSHELRTPLTAIRGYASSLMSTDVDWDGESQRRFLARIGEESARLGRLVDDLLDFSTIDSGILRLAPDWCDLRLVAEAALACLSEPARGQVRIECADDLSVVWADHDRVEQILVNLLDNAVRHNPPGTSVVLRVIADPPGFVTLTVSDDGSGVPAERARGERPSRPERASRRGGAGLGLSIARGIVEAHGGELVVRPRQPGTECVVRLPVSLGAPLDGGGDAERSFDAGPVPPATPEGDPR